MEISNIKALQIEADILMYGYLYVNVNCAENEINVAAIPEGYAGDEDSMPISHEQAVSIIEQAVSILENQEEIPDDDGSGSECAVGLYDKEDEPLQRYSYPETLKYYAFGKIGRLINEIYDNEVVADFLSMGGF